jgi:hypothetical protein
VNACHLGERLLSRATCVASRASHHYLLGPTTTCCLPPLPATFPPLPAASHRKKWCIDGGVRPPSKNWPQGFYKRHPELKAKRVKALDWARHDHNIHDKVLQWFTPIGKELHDPAIVPGNVYNMDETGVLLSVLSSLKVLVSKQDLRNCRGAGVKRTLVTVGGFSDSDNM